MQHEVIPATPGADERSDPPLPQLLSATQVATVFGRTARTVHDWVRRGHLTAVPVGRSRFFRDEEVRALLAGRLAQGLPARARGPAPTP